MTWFFLARALPAVALGILVSLLTEYAARPRPAHAWRRPPAALAIHLGVWTLAFAATLAIFCRPTLAAASVDALFLGLIMINNAKTHSLREPFVFQDFVYIAHALRHPRLYFPFLGLSRSVLALTAIVGALFAGISLEPSLGNEVGRAVLSMTLTGLAAIPILLLLQATRMLPAAHHEPFSDLRSLGFVAFWWRYAADEWSQLPAVARNSRFRRRRTNLPSERPDLIAVQSESFFDARRAFHYVRPDVLAHFDALKESAAMQGCLQVAAWGANTVRTEFAFLSGIDPSGLGVHRFNPYRRLARQHVPTLASYLQSIGYRTVCLHPYPIKFYRRDLVYPSLGFDEFIDIREFALAKRSGPFVSDMAVANRICELLSAGHRTRPLFVFAITMENHGPLHLETLSPDEAQRFCEPTPPADCSDLIVYLRHLANADLMLARLRAALEDSHRPASLCFYGDHVPIMASVYARLGAPDAMTDYLVWNKGIASRSPSPGSQALRVESLSGAWLQQVGLLDRTHCDLGSVSIPAA